MNKPSIHLTAIPKDPPDLDQFVAALLAIAIQRLAAEAKEPDQSSTAEAPRD